MDPRASLDQVRQTWRPPRELERSRPREVLLTGAGKALIVLALALFLGGFFAGLALYARASFERAGRVQLLESGTDIGARITRRWTTGRDPVRYWVEYVYSVEGHAYRGRLQMGRGAWMNIGEVDTLVVRYLPADPRQHLVRGYEGKVLPSWVSILPAGALLIVAWMLTRLPARQRRLLAEGRPAPAIVTKIARTQQGKVAHFVFMAMSGKLISGKSNPQKKPPEAGSILSVIYEPDRESHNSIYPLSLVKTRID
jgi:hypothetical protein